MARPSRKTIRVQASIPEVLIRKWEELQKRESGYLPFDRSKRLELAILEHIRAMEKRLGEPTPPAGSGGRGAGEDKTDEEREREGRMGPEQWHSDETARIPNSWQGYLKVG